MWINLQQTAVETVLNFLSSAWYFYSQSFLYNTDLSVLLRKGEGFLVQSNSMRNGSHFRNLGNMSLTCHSCYTPSVGGNANTRLSLVLLKQDLVVKLTPAIKP